MSGVHDRVQQLRAGLEARRPQAPRQPLRRRPWVRWLRRPLLAGPAPPPRGEPSPFMAGLEDGRREGHDQGHAEGFAEGHGAGYAQGYAAGAASASGSGGT